MSKCPSSRSVLGDAFDSAADEPAGQAQESGSGFDEMEQMKQLGARAEGGGMEIVVHIFCVGNYSVWVMV